MRDVHCLMCKHYMGAWRCLAFPDGIPADIQRGDDYHTKPRRGDNGIQYERGQMDVRQEVESV